MRSIAVLMLCLCALPVTAAQYYTWTDAQGKVHYSDQPPPSGDYQVVSGAPARPQNESATSYERAKNLHQAQQQAEAAAAAREAQAQAAAQTAAIRAENCRRAKANLQALETHTQLLVPAEDGQGGYARLPDEERLRRLEDARAAVEKYCG